ncbi:MAG TPA: ABC transporter ATP-binding protein [Gaiellales bacterium]|nr:ABC transporter ATP-binding protein [Gaiellales bacterium]
MSMTDRPAAEVRDARPGAVIAAAGLTKAYGSQRGIVDVSFTVAAGEVFGFLGPNGAGKTTTIRLMLDLLRPTAGTVELFGLPPGDIAARRRVGYLPGDLRLYDRLTAREHARYFAHLRAMPDLGDAPELAERLGLEMDRPTRQLSRGNRQKVGVMLALMHRPELLILDEPTGGLDPLVQQTFNQILHETTDGGGTVFLSSHVLSEVQHVADRVGVIRDGRLMLTESVETLRIRASRRVEARFAAAPPADAFAGLEGASEISRDGDRVLFALHGEVDALLKRLADYHVAALDSHEADLEDVFLQMYSEGAADAA